MKQLRKILSCFLAVSACLCMTALPLSAASADGTDASADFAVFSTTDFHGKCWDVNVLNDTGVSNSLLKVSTAVKEARETYGENVILIENGDLYQGTPVSSYQISQLTKYLATGSTDGLDTALLDADGNFLTETPMAICLEEIGYDVSVLGNHEFNYAWDAMEYIRADLAEHGVPTLTANIYKEDGSNAFDPYLVKELTVGGQTVKIGIIGMGNTDCARWDVAENYPGLTFALNSSEEAQKYADQLRNNDGCDFVILAYHSGLGSTEGDLGELVYGENSESQVYRVIQNTTGIDMVIAGHDHQTGYSNSTYANKNGEQVLVVNAGGSTLTKSVFTVSADAEGNLSIAQKSSENLDLKNYEDDADLKAKLTSYAAAAENYVNQECGTLTGEWDTVSQMDCYLGQSDTMDLINRAQIAMGTKYIAEKYASAEETGIEGLDHLDIDISSSSVVFGGDYPAQAGALTLKKIYQFYKYDNTLYVIHVTGAEIRQMLEDVAANRLSAEVAEDGQVTFTCIGDFFTNPIFYGLDFTYDLAKEAGSRVTITGFTNGREFTEDGVYLLAINNYHLGNSSAGSPFTNTSTEDAVWSQTDDLGGGVIQDLIAEYVTQGTEENGGVSPEKSAWSIIYTAE